MTTTVRNQIINLLGHAVPMAVVVACAVPLGLLVKPWEHVVPWICWPVTAAMLATAFIRRCGRAGVRHSLRRRVPTDRDSAASKSARDGSSDERPGRKRAAGQTC